MKTHTRFRTILPSLALTVLLLPALSAQTMETNNTNTPPSMPPLGGPGPNPAQRPQGGPMPLLTKEERQQLKAAHDAAIQQDPSLKQKIEAAHQAMEAASRAMSDAMIKIDPSIAPIMAKIAPKKWERRFCPPSATNTNTSGNSGTNKQNQNMTAPNAQWHHQGGMHQGFANLSPAEQSQLKAAREQAKNDPAVIAAQAAIKSSSTPAERHAAGEVMRQVMHDAMIKADPSIAPILEKLYGPSAQNSTTSNSTNGSGKKGNAGETNNPQMPAASAQ